MLKVMEGAFRPMAVSLKRDPQNYMCHAWLPEDRLVLATDHGEILLFENFEFRMVLSSSPQDGEPLYSIQPYSKVSFSFIYCAHVYGPCSKGADLVHCRPGVRASCVVELGA